jgi:CheY-like chemotaxis protein/glycine cleavage system H lipoate-binding protein
MSEQRDILVIEDEATVMQAVVMVCSTEGMSISAASQASEGLKELEQNRFRLILCDIMMQGFDGFRLLEEVARRDIKTPVVMMTGYSTMENAVRSLSAGAVDYLPKPFTADELLTVIRRSLRMGELLGAESAAANRDAGGPDFVSCPSSYYRLGHVSWAVLEEQGPALIGVNDLFLKAIEGIAAIELSNEGDDLVQGLPCAVVQAPDGTSHGIMCPMGGKILEVNSEVQSQPSLLEKDPYFKGWLYRILPSNPENNLKWLSL